MNPAPSAGQKAVAIMPEKPSFLTSSSGEKSGNTIFEPAPPQKTGGDPSVNPASIPSGGAWPKADPGGASGGDIGVGSPGGGRKPFKLKGG